MTDFDPPKTRKGVHLIDAKSVDAAATVELGSDSLDGTEVKTTTADAPLDRVYRFSIGGVCGHTVADHEPCEISPVYGLIRNLARRDVPLYVYEYDGEMAVDRPAVQRLRFDSWTVRCTDAEWEVMCEPDSRDILDDADGISFTLHGGTMRMKERKDGETRVINIDARGALAGNEERAREAFKKVTGSESRDGKGVAHRRLNERLRQLDKAVRETAEHSTPCPDCEDGTVKLLISTVECETCGGTGTVEE